jgi:ectoine hydroxylase-related dioxygenase (phytanoyl-CoA dioxygenase family)
VIRPEFFDEQGYVSPIPLLTSEEVLHYRLAFDEVERNLGKEAAQVKLMSKHFEYPFIWELATHPKILDAVETVYGPNIVLLGTHFFCKYPEPEAGQRFVAWHQDVTYWGLRPPKAISAWLAIDDADQDNGCMRVIAGSHKEGIIEHGKSDRDGNLLSVNQELADERVAVNLAVDLCLTAGTMSLHDGLLVHGSNVNRSNRRRCGLTIRYSTPEIRVVDDVQFAGNWNIVLLRGKDQFGYLEYVAPPTFARS